MERVAIISVDGHVKASHQSATLAEFLGHPVVTDEVARKVLYENAARIYGFDLDALRPHFERVGFHPADVVSAAA